MSSNNMSHHQTGNSRRNRIIIASLVIALCAAGGSIVLQTSRAATSFTAAEAEAGGITAPAAAQTDTAASGGRSVMFKAPASTSTGLYVNPNSHAAAQAVAWKTSNPAGAAVMQRLAAIPQGAWVSDQTNAQIQSVINTYVSASAAAGKLPVIVVYHIFGRDCGKYSAGGASSVADYKIWIDNFSAGIGSRSAMVVIEPDALSELALCLTAAQQQDRLAMIKYAVTSIGALPNAQVYIDAGNPSAQPVATIASRLQQAGIASADGFALNVSGFQTTAENVTYGNAVSALVGGKHYIVDTSRNGNGATADFQWCNPPGRAFGPEPTRTPGLSPSLDALLWIKIPGESDGSCNGSPTSGVWWPEYVLGLAANAGW